MSPRSVLRRLATTALLLAITLVVCLAALEIGVLLALGEQAKFPSRVVGAPFGVRINEPGAHYRHKSADVEVWFRINSRGLRDDEEHAYEKPPGQLRIVSLGDSFTVGYEVDAEETFSNVLERELRESGLDVEVLNAGVAGYSNAEALLYLERELLRYEPDLVLLSFFGNDLVDNTRTGLFRLDGDRLVQTGESYVPGGGLGDFLNTNPFFNFLSERSNAFVLVKEQATLALKRRMVEENLERLEEAGAESADAAGAVQRTLAAAILQRLADLTRANGIPLVIQSIPTQARPPGGLTLIDLFPVEEFDVNQEGVAFLATKPLLEPLLGSELLYFERSHGHWTPRAHDLSGRALAKAILDGGWLGGTAGSASPERPSRVPGHGAQEGASATGAPSAGS